MGEIRSWLRERANEDLTLAFAAGAALLFASLANFLSYNDYPYLRLEVGLVSLGIVALAILMAKFYLPQRQWGRSVLEGLLAAFFVDLNTESVLLIFAAGVGVSAITAWRRISLLGPMAVFGFVVFLTTLGGIGGRSSWINTIDGERMNRTADGSGKPAIVHLILDEHIGIEGLAHEGADGKQLRDELKRFYLTSGFAVYGGAYSQHYHSANSIPYILNFGESLGEAVSRRGVQTGQTKHLQALVKEGYRLTIFQSDYADVCTGANFHECITYDSSSLRPTLAAPMEVQDRAELVLHKVLKLSDMFNWISGAWNVAARLGKPVGIALPAYNTRSGNTSTVGTLELMDVLLSKLKALNRGEAVFAHLLLPHHPYVVGRDCSYLSWGPWEGLRTSASLGVKRRAYYEQIRCTSDKIAAVVRAVSASPAGNDAVFIIHGDHGSRMAKMSPNDQASGDYSDGDLIAVFSTLFAVRVPGIRPHYIHDSQPVAALLRNFAASDFRSAPRPKLLTSRTVYLTDQDWKPVRRIQLPTSWTKGLDRPVSGH